MTSPKTRKTEAAHPAREDVATIAKVLQAASLKLQAFAHEDQFGFVIEFDDALYEGAVAYVMWPEKRFVFAIDLAGHATRDAMTQTAEFLSRANYGMVVGNFEMDWEDGSARFRVGLDYDGAKLDPALVKNIAATALETCDIYAAALADVMQGRLTALEAIQAIEQAES